MKEILLIQASARRSGSLTRALSSAFCDAWQQRFPGSGIHCRDLASDPPPFLSEAWIGAAFTPDDQRNDEQRRLLAASDTLISEVEQAAVVVIATPMYNYGMPAVLKAWFDQVIRIGRTFSFDLTRGDYPLRPRLGGKTLVLLTSSGEFGFADGPRKHMNHLVPHLVTLGDYLGAARRHHLGIEYQEFDDERHRASAASAHAAIPGLVETIAADVRATPARAGGAGLKITSSSRIRYGISDRSPADTGP